MTDIVERLRELGPILGRPSELQQAADEIERLRAELEAAQAREAKLREVLKTANTYMQKAYECLNRKELAPEVCGPNGGYIYSAAERVEWAKNVAREALALPHDDSALKERLRQERERVVQDLAQNWLPNIKRREAESSQNKATHNRAVDDCIKHVLNYVPGEE